MLLSLCLWFDEAERGEGVIAGSRKWKLDSGFVAMSQVSKNKPRDESRVFFSSFKPTSLTRTRPSGFAR